MKLLSQIIQNFVERFMKYIVALLLYLLKTMTEITKMIRRKATPNASIHSGTIGRPVGSCPLGLHAENMQTEKPI